ncbi:MAG: T9SS type A sorting domain-containing protein [Bacteroidetes bacterium]|nr:T9SS type A sorting domain-containing protein [Bacteroidota bacterium]MBK9800381.1 T9SS type A sorting domain-containing protein [Bacteroidota bacterium]
MKTTCNKIKQATYLGVANLSIHSLNGIQYFTALTNLECWQNQLTSLPTLPATLIRLDCSSNQIASLPALPSSLTYLQCGGNNLTSLPTLPNALTELYCMVNQLTSLPALPASLLKLGCPVNQISNLPNLPAGLHNLMCNNNLLTSLPTLPSNLQSLICSSNNLGNLPPLPNSINYLGCMSNSLTSLPTLPTALSTLECSYNQISILPTLPVGLYTLYCGNNQLTNLPTLPVSTHYLYCEDNQLTNLPLIPGNVSLIDISNNPISCFPEIGTRLPGSYWSLINIDSTLISCIPNLGLFPIWVVISSMPLPYCTPSTTTCNYNYTYGYVFIDLNGDGIKDNADKGYVSPINFTNNCSIWSDSSGFFNAASDTGNISFQVAAPLYYTASTPSTQITNVQNGIVDSLFFGIHPIPNIKDLIIDLTTITRIRPGFKSGYTLKYQNIGTDTLLNVQVKFLKPSQLTNLYANPMATSTNGDTLIWSIPSLSPFKQSYITISDSVFASAVLGDTAKAYAWIEPIAGDTTPTNNSSISTNIIRGAYDPNDKSVSPQILSPNFTGNLEYIIRFQNTGTDTAFTVTVTDKLSTLLDVYSLQMLNASHPYELSITNGMAKWVFKKILLPDSNTNQLESHGFIKFKIKSNPGLLLNDSIPNQAKIYFDYNAAVNTNTIVVNVNLVGVKELKIEELKIFPNPVQESLRIVNKNAGPLGKVELFDANGKLLETKTISASSYTWNLQHLPAGTYILKGQGWGKKVVKE